LRADLVVALKVTGHEVTDWELGLAEPSVERVLSSVIV